MAIVIPFKPGMTEKQQEGIVRLVNEKPIEKWTAQDRSNWLYATNGAPFPTNSAKNTLFIDLGHSERFQGAIGFKKEVVWVREIWKDLEPLISKTKWKVDLVPDSFPLDLTSNHNLIRRINYINRNCKDGDWLLSIHGNGATNLSVRGVTTCFMGGSEYMRRKAISLSQAYSKHTGVPVWNGGAFDDRTARYGRLGVCRDTRPPALLIEAGFVTNRFDMEVKSFSAAEAIADWFNTCCV